MLSWHCHADLSTNGMIWVLSAKPQLAVADFRAILGYGTACPEPQTSTAMPSRLAALAVGAFTTLALSSLILSESSRRLSFSSSQALSQPARPTTSDPELSYLLEHIF